MVDATVGDILPVEAIREGNVFGIHEVKAESDCDIIQLRHEAFSRKGFATGAVIAAEFLFTKYNVDPDSDLRDDKSRSWRTLRWPPLP